MVNPLNVTFKVVKSLCQKKDNVVSILTKYPVVMAMDGIRATSAPVMAKIEKIIHFTHRDALTIFASVDPKK